MPVVSDAVILPATPSNIDSAEMIGRSNGMAYVLLRTCAGHAGLTAFKRDIDYGPSCII